MGRIQSVSITRCSLIICCIDAYTGKPPLSSAIFVTIAGLNRQPIRKSGGIFVFTDLELERCEAVISSPFYVEQTVTVDLKKLERNNPVIYIPLYPGPNYSLPERVTGIHGRVESYTGKPAAQLEVMAIICWPSAAVTRLGQEQAEAGSIQLHLGMASGKLAVTDRYLLKSKTEQHEEIIQIHQLAENGRTATLAAPLVHSYQRGDVFYPVTTTLSDQAGVFTLPFRHSAPDTFTVQLVFRDQDKRVVCNRNVEVSSGQFSRLQVTLEDG